MNEWMNSPQTWTSFTASHRLQMNRGTWNFVTMWVWLPHCQWSLYIDQCSAKQKPEVTCPTFSPAVTEIHRKRLYFYSSFYLIPKLFISLI
jgi:hypothetical protein